VTDAFAELGIPRRPWADPSVVKSQFHELAAHAHPDKGGSEDSLARLNQARKCLASHGSRLRQLAELAFPDHQAEKTFVPDWTLFESVGNLCRHVDGWRSKRELAGSALERAVVMAGGVSLEKQAAHMIGVIHEAERIFESRLREVDARWPDVPADELLVLADEWTFLQRSGDSLRAALAVLAGA